MISQARIRTRATLASFFFFQAEDGIRDVAVTGVQTCALPIWWQAQKTGIGVQQKVEEALAELFPGQPRVHSSSRTDAGVHALGMVAHVEIPKAEFKMPARKLVLALNAWLPEDIRVMSARLCRGDFHSRFDATGKQYRYLIWNQTAMNPLLRHQAWHVPTPLDLAAMHAAARRFLGKHDFKSFD